MSFFIAWLVAILQNFVCFPKTIDAPPSYTQSPSQLPRTAVVSIPIETLLPPPVDSALVAVSPICDSPGILGEGWIVAMVASLCIFLMAGISLWNLHSNRKNFIAGVSGPLQCESCEDGKEFDFDSYAHYFFNHHLLTEEAGRLTVYLNQAQELCSYANSPVSVAVGESEEHQLREDHKNSNAQLALVLSEAQETHAEYVTKTAERMRDLRSQLERSTAAVYAADEEIQKLRGEMMGLESRLSKMKRDHVREKIELAQQVSVLKERVGDAEWKAYRVDSMSAELEALNAKLDEAGKNGEASCCMIRERDHTIETLLARM